jgi:hypothetical protein
MFPPQAPINETSVAHVWPYLGQSQEQRVDSREISVDRGFLYQYNFTSHFQ